jgi:hypothetical protein
MRTSLSSGMAFNHGANEVPKTSRSILQRKGLLSGNPLFFIGLVLLLMVILVGCSSRSELVPGPGADIPPGNTMAAISTVDNVHMEVEADAWKGQQEILQEITPLRVVIKNNSGKSIQIEYKDFALTDPKGKRYSALPPYGIKGTVEKPYLVQTYPAIYSPDFDYDGFWVAPYYASIYPDIPDWDEPFDFDPWYYNQYYTYWQSIKLPTEKMLKRVLPAGVLDNGGHLTGFLYFQEVNPDVQDVTFTANLVDAKTGEIFGTISIPFKVIKAS